MTPFKVLEKLFNLYSSNFQKSLKTSLPENAKTRQNHRSFEVAIVEGKQFSKNIYFYYNGTSNFLRSLFLIIEKNSFIQESCDIAIQSEFESNGLTLGDPQGTAFHTIYIR